MNLIEALKSGKRIKRRSHSRFWSCGECSTFYRESILADDWEVEEEKIEVTAKELGDAVLQYINSLLKPGGYIDPYNSGGYTLLSILKKNKEASSG